MIKRYIDKINKMFYRLGESSAKALNNMSPFPKLLVALIGGLILLWLFFSFLVYLFPFSLIFYLILLGLYINYRFTYKKEQERIKNEAIEKEIRHKKELLEQENRKKKAFEQEQNRKGLFLFTDRHGNEKWAKAKDVERWEKDEQQQILKESLFGRIVDSINRFPSIRQTQEAGYQNQLMGWLQQEFPEVVKEKQDGNSRPDLVIGNVAIEIKGPTYTNDMDTLTTKCLKYSRHYKHMILVLFDPHFRINKNSDLFVGIKRDYPNVEIIIKPLDGNQAIQQSLEDI